MLWEFTNFWAYYTLLAPTSSWNYPVFRTPVQVTPQDLGLEKAAVDDEAVRRLFARYYERLSAEHTRVQIQVACLFLHRKEINEQQSFS